MRAEHRSISMFQYDQLYNENIRLHNENKYKVISVQWMVLVIKPSTYAVLVVEVLQPWGLATDVVVVMEVHELALLSAEVVVAVLQAMADMVEMVEAVVVAVLQVEVVELMVASAFFSAFFCYKIFWH